MPTVANSSRTIELNAQFKAALSAIEAGKHVFVTGKAGTGKSTLLSYFRAKSSANLVVLAPTGVAAVNIAGQTIHSFFRFRPDITVEKVKQKYKKPHNAHLYRSLTTIIIDEISMVRADLFDCVDAFLRMHGPKKGEPFGGIQMILIGDLYQLPPVVTGAERQIFSTHYQSPYFFDAKAFSGFEINIIELEKIYRQKDEGFIRILNGIRNRSIDEVMFAKLNTRVRPDFEPEQKKMHVYLVTTNAKAQDLNFRELSRLPGKKWNFEGELRGEFDRKALPAPLILELKTGSQVMLTNNDRELRWVNGTVGSVQKIETTEEGDVIWVKLETGETVDVSPHRWDMFRFAYNQNLRRIDTETVGSYTQYPLLLAWALTIHKSQGKTFERVIVDMDRGAFAHGQTYVALSRATSLSGLVLKKPIEKKHLLLDWRVVKFLTGFAYARSEERLSLADKVSLIKQAITAKRGLEITYLKANDEKSRRTIRPAEVGKREYLGKTFTGVVGFDELRGEERVFRVDRILELKVIY